MSNKNLKAGIFVLATLVLLAYMTVKVGQGGLFRGGTYKVYMDVSSAVGLDEKTPVQIAGVSVGNIKDIELTPQNKARIKMILDDDVHLTTSAKGMVKQTGILGDSYIEIIPGFDSDPQLKDGDHIASLGVQGDLSSMTGQFSLIAEDVKAITKQMRKLMAGDDSSFTHTMKNLEKITKSLAEVTENNQHNIEAIIQHMRVITQNVNYMVARNMGHVNNTLYNLDQITTDVERGKGTVGRLLKDEETVDRLNETLESLNEFVGGASRLNIVMDAHTEYLAGTGDVKNYVSLELQPRPDKAFIFSVNSDPDPSFKTQREITQVTSGNNTSTIETVKRIKEIGRFHFSAQLAKKFEDFTIRGGLIESSGGIGLDYNKGPLGIQFSAFDFKTDFGEKPHLKAMGTLSLTKTFYLLGGADDFINPNQDLAWFMGGGIRFTDEDIKSLLGLFAATAR